MMGRFTVTTTIWVFVLSLAGGLLLLGLPGNRALADRASDDINTGPAQASSETPPADTPPLDRDKARFSVQFSDEVIPYRVFGVYVMPGDNVPLSVLFAEQAGGYRVEAAGGTVAPVTNRSFRWLAPDEPGLYPITVTDTTSNETIRLNAFVLTPHDPGQERLNGYRIGSYQGGLFKGNANYKRPEGFIEVTADNRNAKVAPNFTLDQFLCKQSDQFPQYLLLRERLILKLEMILDAVNDAGIPANTFHIMSGYRTPYYNRLIGNTTTRSRHLYGGAADIFIDMNGDGVMDDITGDNRVTRADAERLARIVESQTDEVWYKPFVGGLGIYGPAAHRGPFIHVDARGTPARW